MDKIVHIICRFSKSVLDIKTRLVVAVELGTKWMPNSDSVSHFMPEYKFLGYQDLSNSFYGYLKITRFFKNYMDFPYENNSGENFFPQVHFYMEKPYKNLRKRQFSDSCKNSLAGRIDPKFCI